MGRSTHRTPEKSNTVHPQAPAGGGGPGFFRVPPGMPRTASQPVHPLAPAARYVVAQAGSAAASSMTKPPPVTAPLTAPVKKEKTADVDIEVTVEVLKDGKRTDPGLKGAKTSFDVRGLHWQTPAYTYQSRNGVEAVTQLKGPFILKGTITIQTVYGPAAKPDQTSLYGRGTTTKDKKDGHTTLGFHEYCHRQDYLQYLQNRALPVFTGTVGMSVAAYKRAVSQFESAFKTYFADMEHDSFKKTDEVGYTKSQCKRDGKCL